MPRSFRLMLTSTGGGLAPQLIRLAQASLRHRIEVVAVDMRSDVLARYMANAFATVPGGKDPAYIEAVKTIAVREGVNLIIPGSDEEALALSRAAPQLQELGVQVAVASHDILKVVSDKTLSYKALAAAGIKLPWWRRVESAEELRDAVIFGVAEYGSAVVKPVSDRGSRGVYVIKGEGGAILDGGAREIHLTPTHFLEKIAAKYSYLPALVMERLEEPVHDIDMLAWEGKPIRIIPRRRVSSALPNSGHVFLKSDELTSLGEAVARALKLTWLYDCDVMFNAKGQPQILEVNPRPSGSWAVSVVAGVPLLDDIVSLAKGEPVGAAENPAGRTVIPYQALHRIG